MSERIVLDEAVDFFTVTFHQMMSRRNRRQLKEQMRNLIRILDKPDLVYGSSITVQIMSMFIDLYPETPQPLVPISYSIGTQLTKGTIVEP